MLWDMSSLKMQRARTQLEFNEELRESGKLGDMQMALQLFAKAILGDKANDILRWNMIDLIVESPFYKEIINKGMEEGREQGLEQGREQGLEQGKKEESQKLLLKQLAIKFGELSENIKQNITRLSLEQSENMAEAIFDFQTLEDVNKWLESNGTKL